MPVDFDESYVKRLVNHASVLIAYEDTVLAHDKDRVMLALVFMRNHCEMVLAELGPDIIARAEKKR